MSQPKFLLSMSLLLAMAVIAWSFGPVFAQTEVRDKAFIYHQKVSPSERKAAVDSCENEGHPGFSTYY